MAELIVNTGALLQNYRRYAEAGQVIPILKGNGYGLGAQPLRDLLARQGVTLFACATPEEALALAQPETDLLLLCCVHELPLLRALLQRRVILPVESLAQAQAIDALHMDARVHLAVDSGFGRFGFLPEQTEEMKRVFALDNLRVQGIFSHFRGAAAAPEQFARFSRVLLELDGYPVGLRHIAATRTADVPQYRLDAVRIGSALLGRVNDAAGRQLLTGAGAEPSEAFMACLERQLEQPVTAVLEAEVCTVRRLKKGDRVGYGDTLLRRDTEVAVLAAGTSDGAFTYRDRGLRAFWKQRRKYVLLHGAEAPVIAPPGLTHTMVDVTGLDCHPGDRAVIPHDLVLTSEHVLRRYTEE